MDSLVLFGFDLQRLLAGLGIGFVAGIVSGVLGIGGGPVLVPAMVFILDVSQKTAQGTALAIIVPTAIAGAMTHYRLGNVRAHITAWLIPAAVAGAVVGALFVAAIDAVTLRRIFGVLLLVLSVQMFWSRARSAH
ncbi:MAG: sulfite exporter TauE/SafE family protein [Chloroflexi bacterium]|nr:sulfite exporter TauE/SafE family protein [Chloroflexota bacterium]